MEQQIIQSTKPAIHDLINLAVASRSKLWVDYDKEADVLYISFGKPQKAEDATHEHNIIKRTSKGKIVGITILNASSYSRQ